ncbi:MAG TPA: hypothetical protein VHE30_04165 [Polyangiaceae bacterium]|nr:hypothetical protein [Polyangiaceae bacterium]
MSRRRRYRARGVLIAALFAGLATAGCASALIGGGVVVVALSVAALTYECEEGIGVTVWDPAQAHTVCDARVVARQEGKEIRFSPCYMGYVGKGTWTISAEKEGFVAAEGTVTIPPEHKCSEPVYHSVELTLRRVEGYGAPGAIPPPGYVPPPGYAPSPTPAPAYAPPAYGPPPQAPVGPGVPAPAPAPPPAPSPAPVPAPGTGVAPPTSAFPSVPTE